jgi:hypothetical protein
MPGEVETVNANTASIQMPSEAIIEPDMFAEAV